MLDSRPAALAVAVLSVFAGCATSRPLPPSSTETVQAEVRSALERWNDLSGRGDLAAFMSQFEATDDIVLVGSDKGEVFKGRAEIEGWLGKLMVRNRFSWQMDRVEISVNGDTAWVFVDGAMTVRSTTGQVRGSTPYRFAGVLVKRGDAWLWRLFDGSVPAGH